MLSKGLLTHALEMNGLDAINLLALIKDSDLKGMSFPVSSILKEKQLHLRRLRVAYGQDLHILLTCPTLAALCRLRFFALF